MKLRFVFLWSALFWSVNAFSGGIPYDQFGGWFKSRWTPLQLSFVPGLSLFSSDTPVYGISFGGPLVIQEKVYGLNLSLLGAMANHNAGIMMAPVNLYSENFGVSVGMVNIAVHDYSGVQLGVCNWDRSLRCGGVQLGVVNFAVNGWQFGLLNFNRNPKAWLPFTILFNYSPVPEERGETPFRAEWKWDGVTVTAGMEKGSFAADAPLGFKVEYRNDSKRDILVTICNPRRDFTFEMSDAATGAVILRNNHDVFFLGDSAGSRSGKLVRPGEKFSYGFDLRELYSLPTGGEYRFSVKGSYRCGEEAVPFSVGNVTFSISGDRKPESRQ